MAPRTQRGNVSVVGIVMMLGIAVSVAVGVLIYVTSNSGTKKQAARPGPVARNPDSPDGQGDRATGDGSRRGPAPSVGFFDRPSPGTRRATGPGAEPPAAPAAAAIPYSPPPGQAAKPPPQPAPAVAAAPATAPDRRSTEPPPAPLAAAPAQTESPAPQPAPAASPERTRAEQFYAAAAGAPPADAIAALHKAVANDPAHVQARLLLAELLIDRKQIKGAAEQLSRAGELARSPATPDEIKARLAAAEKKLLVARWPAAKWATQRPVYSARYRGLADPQANPPPPSTLIALRHAEVLKPDDAALSELCDKAEAAMPQLPQPAEAPDPAGARLLHDKARQHMAANKLKEAQDLLLTAVTLDADQARYWCDLGICCHGTKDVRAAAALVEARENLGPRDSEAVRTLDAKIRALLDRMDPKLKVLDQIDLEAGREGNFLIARSREIGDEEAAEAIAADLRALGIAVNAPGPARVASADNPPGKAAAPATPQVQPRNATGQGVTPGPRAPGGRNAGARSARRPGFRRR